MTRTIDGDLQPGLGGAPVPRIPAAPAVRSYARRVGPRAAVADPPPGQNGHRAYNPAHVTAEPIRFGTDGWRAIVADDFTYERVRAVSQAVAWMLDGDPRPVVVGHDTRYCAELFAQEVARVLTANGRHVILLDGPAPTQVSSWTVVARGAAGGVVVTASHNPPEFNGLKYKPDFGGSAPPEVSGRLEELSARALVEGVTSEPFEVARARAAVEMVDPFPAYEAQLGRMVDLDRLRSSGLNILHEAMHGAGAGVIARLLAGGATTVTSLHAERNPGFGGMHPEPIARYMPQAMERMLAGGFDLCIANDGDADRVGIVDERGVFINQLEVMALLCMYLLEKRGQRGALIRSLTTTNMVDLLGASRGYEANVAAISAVKDMIARSIDILK